MLRFGIVISFIIAGLTGCYLLEDDEEQGPPAEVAVSSVTDLGVLEANSFVSMRDGGYSAQFAGRSVWLYGDTFLSSPNEQGSQFISNTWTWTTDLDAADGISGFQDRVDSLNVPTTFFPLTLDEQNFNDLHKGEDCIEKPCDARWGIWPGALVVDADKNWAYIFYNKIYAEPGNFNFRTVGQSIAVWKDFALKAERPVFNQIEDYPTLLFAAHEPAFGSATLLVDSTLYIYGCDLAHLTKPCRLARAPISDVLDRSAWRYFMGDGNWSSELSNAVSVFNGNDMMTVFYNPHLERYLAVYSRPLDSLTLFRTAPNPEGPWSRPLVAFNAKAPNNNTGWVYDALAHPEYSTDNWQEVYVSYTREIGKFSGEVRLVRVAIEKATN